MNRIASSVLACMTLAAPISAQYPPGQQSSQNLHVLSHLPIGRMFTVADLEIEQELARPYAYVSRMHGSTYSAGFTIVDLRDPRNVRVSYEWRTEDPELHEGPGGMDNKYFKLGGRYYDVQSFQFRLGGPDADLGAIVFDVTGLPDTATIAEVARIRAPDVPGGFHDVFAYKHSSGRVLLYATTGSRPLVTGSFANVYDMQRLLAGDPQLGLIGHMPVPAADASAVQGGYHDFYVGYDPASRSDRFYGARGEGYYIYDVTAPEDPQLLTVISGVPGVTRGHTFTPSPDGRYGVGETEHQYAPLYFFDLGSGQRSGSVRTISRPIGAWTHSWKNLPHNTEVRWPYVFVSAYQDGLHVVNVMDPTSPHSVAYYDTWEGPDGKLSVPPTTFWPPFDDPDATRGVYNGAFGVDVRNADGLIAMSDITTGFWTFRLDGFDGWTGHQWGMPNVSSAQDWERGPAGASGPGRVS